MHKQVVAMVLAGGRVDELSVLTAKRPKSAVPVWGIYRFIDFVLSNLVNSGIDTVGVLSQYRPHSLNQHLAGGQPWDLIGRTRELRILSPYRGAEDTDWYKGTADAVYQNLAFLRIYSPELVLIASGDHAYAMDYRPMIREHLANGADLTVALKRVPREQAPLFGTAELASDGRVVDYQEKAAAPRSDLASLTVYVFSYDALVRRVLENQADGSRYQIYSEIIPRMVAEGDRVYGHVFDGYWQYARTLDSYYRTNLDLLSPAPPDLARWGVRSNLDLDVLGDPPPARFLPTAHVSSSLACPAAVIAGQVDRALLSPEVVIERGATVRESILMHGCRIETGAVVENAILDKRVVVGAGARIGAIGGPLTVIGKGVALPEGIAVGPDCIVGPDIGADRFTAARLEPGTRMLT